MMFTFVTKYSNAQVNPLFTKNVIPYIQNAIFT
jgi:hypothetical protein